MPTTYRNTKVKGDQAELEALAFLTRQGYRVSIPFGENSPYDLVVESPTRVLYRVQVRWSTWDNGVLSVRLRMHSKNYTKTLDLDRIDVFAIFDGENIYLVPTSALRHCKAEFSLRETAPRNNQKQGVSMADTFLGATHLIP